MARFNISFSSELMMRTVQVTVILPEERENDIPILYALHGMRGNHDSWLKNSTLEYYAVQHHFAVICADAENSYYTDQAFGYPYHAFFTRELPAKIHGWFPQLTEKREKTYVMGLSMGGYGALRLALELPERFAGAAALSPVTDLVWLADNAGFGPAVTVCNWGIDFSETLSRREFDPAVLARNALESGKCLPRIYQACGRQDSLYKPNLCFREAMAAWPSEKYVFEEKNGCHDWNFWQEFFPRALSFIMQL